MSPIVQRLAALERLVTLLLREVAALKRRVADVEQKLREARGS